MGVSKHVGPRRAQNQGLGLRVRVGPRRAQNHV